MSAAPSQKFKCRLCASCVVLRLCIEREFSMFCRQLALGRRGGKLVCVTRAHYSAMGARYSLRTRSRELERGASDSE